jgi:hypothetical protein
MHNGDSLPVLGGIKALWGRRFSQQEGPPCWTTGTALKKPLNPVLGPQHLSFWKDVSFWGRGWYASGTVRQRDACCTKQGPRAISGGSICLDLESGFDTA